MALAVFPLHIIFVNCVPVCFSFFLFIFRREWSDRNFWSAALCALHARPETVHRRFESGANKRQWSPSWLYKCAGCLHGHLTASACGDRAGWNRVRRWKPLRLSKEGSIPMCVTPSVSYMDGDFMEWSVFVCSTCRTWKNPGKRVSYPGETVPLRQRSHCVSREVESPAYWLN